MAMRKRPVSCLGLVAFPISHQVGFPLRQVDFDFQIRGLRLLSVSPSHSEWLLAKPPAPLMSQRALLLQRESLLDWPAEVFSTPGPQE